MENLIEDLINYERLSLYHQDLLSKGITPKILPWTSATEYTVGRLVLNEGSVLVCKKAHTSRYDISTDVDNWAVLVSGAGIDGDLSEYAKRSELTTLSNTVARFTVNMGTYAKKTDIPSSKDFATAEQLAQTNQNVTDLQTTVNNMYTNDEINTKLEYRALQSDTYTKAEVDAQIAAAELRAGGDISADTIKAVIAGVGYAKTADVAENYVSKTDLADAVYTKTEVDEALKNVTIDTSSLATKESLDALSNTVTEMYTNSALDEKFALYAPQETTYTKTEVDEAIAKASLGTDAEVTESAILTIVKNNGYVTSDDISGLATQESVDTLKATVDNLYTNDEINAMFANIPAVEVTQDYVNSQISTALKSYSTSEYIAEYYATKNDLKNITIDTSDFVTRGTTDALSKKIDDINNNTIPTLATKEELKNVTVDTSGLATTEALSAVDTKVDTIINTTIPTLATKDDLKNITIDVSGLVTEQELQDALNSLPAVEVDKEYVTNAVAEGVKPYLLQTDATNTYLSKTDAGNTYLSKTDAGNTYLTKEDAKSTYLTEESADKLFVSQTDIDNVEKKVDTAVSDASSAKTSAATAVATSNTANDTADSAKSTAESAKTTAEDAKKSADASATAVTQVQVDMSALETKVDKLETKLTSLYIVGGSCYFDTLPTPSKSLVGYVYNVIDAFTTDERFLEGAGVETAAGTNVVVCQLDSTSFGFDLLAIGTALPTIANKDEVLKLLKGETTEE